MLDLPATAVICSCENISKGQLTELLDDGTAQSVKDLAGCCGAGTGCGGCKPMLNNLVDSYLKSQGKVVRNVICDHFPYTRQELRDLIGPQKDQRLRRCLEPGWPRRRLRNLQTGPG